MRNISTWKFFAASIDAGRPEDDQIVALPHLMQHMYNRTQHAIAYDILYNRPTRTTWSALFLSGRTERSQIMNILTFSEARAGLKSVMDNVCTDHTPTVITRVNGEHVVMLSLADFNSIQETICLLGSAKNASRLMESVAQIKAGNAQPRELIRDEKQEGRK